MPQRLPKVIGIGLNKTGTTTLGYCLRQWGYRHQSFELPAFELFRSNRIDGTPGFHGEFRQFRRLALAVVLPEIDARFPDAKFILTTRSSADRGYQSLCKMAARAGPFNNDFERYIYGYAMPHDHRAHHIDFYRVTQSCRHQLFRRSPPQTHSSVLGRLHRHLGVGSLSPRLPVANPSPSLEPEFRRLRGR
ncbi:MAG: hypothetical protein J6386_20085 [Candidatus Synoicihabitans palmerolidicus]|nr:hypothetical protein [Candidatus Synoicihabitans palmerolidicus]